ncbi:MAG: type VI secretion system contractile sheath small subunit [Escherichia coli]
MAESFQNEVPAARVNIKLDLHTGNAKKKVELPSLPCRRAITVTERANVRWSERDKVDINKANFNMAEFFAFAVNLTVEDTPNGNGNEQNFALEFKKA